MDDKGGEEGLLTIAASGLEEEEENAPIHFQTHIHILFRRGRGNKQTGRWMELHIFIRRTRSKKIFPPSPFPRGGPLFSPIFRPPSSQLGADSSSSLLLYSPSNLRPPWLINPPLLRPTPPPSPSPLSASCHARHKVHFLRGLLLPSSFLLRKKRRRTGTESDGDVLP